MSVIFFKDRITREEKKELSLVMDIFNDNKYNIFHLTPILKYQKIQNHINDPSIVRTFTYTTIIYRQHPRMKRLI